MTPVNETQMTHSEVMGELESPRENQVVGEAFNLRGWAYSPADRALSIEIYIDGALVKRGNCEFPRYDVYRKYLTESAYLSGFMVRVASGRLSVGNHLLEVRAVYPGGNQLLRAINFRKRRHLFLTSAARKALYSEQPLMGGAGPAMGIQRNVSQNLLKQFIRLGGLQPDHDVLDIGCGVGRVALALTGYLDSEGSYTGTDNVKETIDYASTHIMARYPHFRFQFTNVASDFYNPSGTYRASEYEFEFRDNSFDFIFLTSVFTHMKCEDVRHYLQEIARMLKPGNRCFITWFVLNDTTRENIKLGLSKRTFQYKFNGFFSDARKNPEGAIAYEENTIRSLYKEASLTIEEPIHLGRWSGLQGPGNQDIIVAIKA